MEQGRSGRVTLPTLGLMLGGAAKRFGGTQRPLQGVAKAHVDPALDDLPASEYGADWRNPLGPDDRAYQVEDHLFTNVVQAPVLGRGREGPAPRTVGFHSPERGCGCGRLDCRHQCTHNS
jgi:hypothetical protein